MHPMVGGHHDLGDLFKGHLGCCQSFDFAAEAPELCFLSVVGML